MNSYFNPYYQPYNRMSNMEQNYNFTPSVQQQGYRMVAVSDVAEANATTVDKNGLPTFFYNKSKNEIYLKALDVNTGGAIFQKFSLATMPINESKGQNDKDVYSDKLNSIEGKLDSLALLFEDKKKKKVDND